MRPRVCAFALLGLLGLGACITTGESGKPFDPAPRRRIAAGWTTRLEARRLLGEPRSIAPGPAGGETWTYEHTKVSALALPLLGEIVARQAPHLLLTIRFQYGVVADCSFFREDYRSRGTRIVPAAAVREPCAR